MKFTSTLLSALAISSTAYAAPASIPAKAGLKPARSEAAEAVQKGAPVFKARLLAKSKREQPVEDVDVGFSNAYIVLTEAGQDVEKRDEQPAEDVDVGFSNAYIVLTEAGQDVEKRDEQPAEDVDVGFSSAYIVLTEAGKDNE